MALLNYWRERRNRLSTMTRRLFSNIPCNTFCAPPRFSASRFFPPFFLRGGGVSTAAGSRRRRFYQSNDAVADKTRPWCPGRPLRYCLWYRRMEEKRHWSAVRRDGVETKTKVEPKRTDGRTVGKRGGGGGYTRDGVAGLIRLRWNTCEAARPVGWTRWISDDLRANGIMTFPPLSMIHRGPSVRQMRPQFFSVLLFTYWRRTSDNRHPLLCEWTG